MRTTDFRSPKMNRFASACAEWAQIRPLTTSSIPRGLLSCLGLAAFVVVSSSAFAQAESPDLGDASEYTVLGTNSAPTSGTVTCTNTGPGSTINGDVGTTFTSITNTGCTITGAIDAPVPGSVVTDFNNAYAELDSANPVCDSVIPTVTTTLPPGVYCSAAGTTIGAGVIFTLDGSATDVWVFKVGTSGNGALTTDSFQMVMGGSAQACNVFWRTAEAATMTDSDFIGSVLAGTSITSTRGSYLGRALATTDATVTDAAEMTFAGCAAPATITVNKDFIPDSVASVPVDLNCTSGIVSDTPQDASEAAPAVFTVGGADPMATCTATETVPPGYTADQTDCEDVPLGGSCTITNTLNPNVNTITVFKDFIPDSMDAVSVDLTCSSGTVNVTPLDSSEATPAVFTVTGARARGRAARRRRPCPRATRQTRRAARPCRWMAAARSPIRCEPQLSPYRSFHRAGLR